MLQKPLPCHAMHSVRSYTNNNDRHSRLVRPQRKSALRFVAMYGKTTKIPGATLPASLWVAVRVGSITVALRLKLNPELRPLHHQSMIMGKGRGRESRLGGEQSGLYSVMAFRLGWENNRVLFVCLFLILYGRELRQMAESLVCGISRLAGLQT